MTLPRSVYVRALEYVTGKPVASLGFDSAAERYGLDPDEALATGTGPWIPVADPKTQPGPLTGIWLSSYEYESTGRGATFTSTTTSPSSSTAPDSRSAPRQDHGPGS